MANILRSAPSPMLAAPLLFLSGAVALGCEVAWQRSLTLLLGASLPASGALLGAFMLGLLLGSEVGARRADRTASPLRAYAAAEALVGLCALTSGWLCPLVQRATAGTPFVVRFGLALVLLLLPPTFAMGTTLPFVSAAVLRARSSPLLHRGLALLYGANLLGGVAGALLCGLFALPHLGLRSSVVAFGLLALATAAAALLLAGPSGPRHSEVTEEVAIDALAGVLLLFLGVVSFSLQVAWNRAFATLLGSSAYTFCLVLATIVGALGLGGLRGRPGDGPFFEWVARRCLALAIFAHLGTLAIFVAPHYLARAAAGENGAFPELRLLLILLVVAPPSYQIGALFPALASRYPSLGIGRAVGRAALAATLGNVGGALFSAIVAVPRFGVQITLNGAAAAALLLSLVALTLRLDRLRRYGYGLSCLLSLALATALHLRWDPVGMAAGAYRIARYRERVAAAAEVGEPCGPRRRFPLRRALFQKDGALGTVVVVGHGAADCSLYSMRVNGKAEGSLVVRGPLAERVARDADIVPRGDYPAQVLAGFLPGMAGAAPARSLLVGFGTGFSAQGLLAAGALDVLAVELEPAVLAAAQIFGAVPMDDPRLRFRVEDARVALAQAAPASLDLIASHPSNPWVAGAGALYSREYFALAADRLRRGGRMMAWIQLYEIDREAVRSLVATFTTAFPDAHAFRPGRADLLLLGLRSDGDTALAELSAMIEARMTEPARAALHRAGIRDVAALMERYQGGGERLRRWAKGAPLSTEDNGLLEFRVADHLMAGTEDDPDEILRGL